MENIIYKPIDAYNNKLEPVRDYRDLNVDIIMKMKGYSRERAERIMGNIIKERYKKRIVKFSYRKENGDQLYRECDIFAYIASHVKAGNVITPSFTTYTPVTVKRSVWSSFMKGNVKNRAIEKSEASKAFADGNITLGRQKHGQQAYSKLKNNILSGLFISASSVVTNPTAHSALTSMTRTMTSLTNACNERLLTGNRALYTPEYALFSIVNEAKHCNKEKIREAINEYGLHIPSVEEIVKMLKYSSDIYNRDDHYYNKYIIPYLNNCTDEERAGILYTLDLYHLWIYNEKFTRLLMDKLTYKETNYNTEMEDISLLENIETSIRYFAHNIFADDIRGMGTDYKRMNKAGIAHNLYMTCLNIMKVMEEYKTYFNAFFMVDIRPINSHRLQYLRRRTVNLSDTDSSGFDANVPLELYVDGVFSITNAAKFLSKSFRINAESIAFTGALTYLSSESVVHQLSTLSCAMNIEKAELRRIAMKNEWYWPTFAVTNNTKHYFADALIQEGNVKPVTVRETKGVGLIASSIPESVRKLTYDLMGKFLEDVRDKGEISLTELLQVSLEIEDMIITSLKQGSTEFFSTIGIKPQENGKSPFEGMYYHHHLWKTVFAPKYGYIPEPDYRSIKVPVELGTARKMKEWLESIEDREFAKRFEDWLEESGKKSLDLIQFELDYIKGNGIPEEVLSCVNFEKTVLSLTKQLKLIMSTFGLVVDDTRTLKSQFIDV